MESRRLSLKVETPRVHASMRSLDASVADLGLEPRIRELIKIRASQMNGCVYCIDLHTREARSGGESEERIYALSAWRESPLFDRRESAALELCESMTLVSETRVPDGVYRRAAEVFDDRELAALMWTIVVINAWNRVAVATRMLPASQSPLA